jgi:hypothetical protein
MKKNKDSEFAWIERAGKYIDLDRVRNRQDLRLKLEKQMHLGGKQPTEKQMDILSYHLKLELREGQQVRRHIYKWGEMEFLIERGRISKKIYVLHYKRRK